MRMYCIRRDETEVAGPYALDLIQSWLASGQLAAQALCSEDGRTWVAAGDLPELGGTGTPVAAPPQIALYIRQGANVQGPYAFSRIRGYVAQRRIQPYMLFSPDGIWWCIAQHVPGLLPAGYTPVAPPTRPTAVPTVDPPPSPAPAAARSASASAPAPAPVAAPVAAPAAPAAGGAVRDVGSSTLTGIQLTEEDMRPPALGAARGGAEAAAWYVRQERRHVYGPFAEDELRGWIADGRLGPDAEFSTDGASWVLGARLPSFFPHGGNRAPGTRAPAPAAPTPAAPALVRRARRTR